MSEFQFPVPEISKKAEFSSPQVSIFVHFFFNIVSHPIYFSYFIFFTPYIFKLLTFLIPLFVTSSLLLLAILSASPNLIPDEFHRLLSDSQVGFLLNTYRHVLQKFYFTGVGKDENFGYFEQLEAFKIMLETSLFEGFESKSEVADCTLGFEEESSIVVPLRRTSTDVNSFECHGDHQEEVDGVKKLESFFQEETESELVKPLDAELNKVEAQKEKVITKERSYYDCNDGHDDTEIGYASKVKVTTSQRLEANTEKPKVAGDKQSLCGNLGGFGSIRKEKEWRRSLACKLFEERHNVGGVEGMDMLWETYETESNKARVDSNRNKDKKLLEVEDSEDEDEYGDRDGKLCCLHALKFSAGKVNLGMGRPNLMKISKAFKGIGWWHRVSKNRKKGYH